MGVQTFHLLNVSGQGIVLSFYVNGINLTHTLNAGEDYEFEADLLSPETQNAIQMGYLTYLSGSALTVTGGPKAGFPIVYRRNYYPTVKYVTGDLILFGGALWLCQSPVYGQTPLDNTSAWVAFLSDLGGGNHQFDTNNPHQTTAAQVGAIATSEKGASNGVAPLVGGKVPAANLPDASVANGDTKLAEGTPSEVSASALRLHLDSLNNPHQVTAAQIGAIAAAAIGANNGVAPLDAGGLIPAAYLPTSSGGTGLVPVYAVTTLSQRDALISGLTAGSLVAVLQATSPVVTARVFRWTGTAFVDTTETAKWVFHVNGMTGPSVTLTTDNIAEANGKFYFTDSRLGTSAAFVAVQAASHAQNSDTKLANGTGNEVTAAQLKAHLTSTSNPHGVTATQIGALTALSGDVAPTLSNAMSAAGFRILNLGTPTLDTDAATKAYVDGIATIAIGGGVLTVNGRAGAVTLSIADVAATASALRAAITGTTGTAGNLVFSVGPTLTSPVLNGASITNALINTALATDTTFVGSLTSIQAGKIQGTCQTLNVAELVSTAVLSSGTYYWSAANGGFSRTTLVANGIVDFPSSAKDGCTYTVLLIQGGSGGYTVTWHANFIFNGSPPTLKTGVGEADSFQFSCYGGKLYCTSHGGSGGGGAAADVYAFFDTGSHVLTNETVVSVQTTGAPVNLELPAVAAAVGVPITIQRTKGGTSAPALVSPASGEAIEDYFSGIIPVNLGESITFFSDGTVWKVISNLVNVMRITGDQYIQDEKTFTNLKAQTLKADGFSTGVTVLTADATLDLQMTSVDVSAVTASFEVTLPDPATCDGKVYHIYRSDDTAARYVRIVTPVGNIEYTPNYDLSYVWDSVVVQALDGKWVVIASSVKTLQRRILDECIVNAFTDFAGGYVFGMQGVAGATSYSHVVSATSGNAVKFTADGVDPNVDVLIEGKGTGVARTTTATLGTNTTQIATTAFVNGAVAAIVNGLSWKGVCRAATTANVNLASGLVNAAVIDGVTLATGDRVLVKDQTAPAENGVYVVAASGAASRATDADTGAKLVNASVYVSEGSVAADKQYTCTTNAPITLGSTAITFTNFASGVTYLNGTGILLTGATFSIDTAVVMDLTTAQTASNKTFSSVTLTGVPVAPTAAPGTATTQIATTEFVDDAIAAIDLDTIPVARLAFSTASRVAVTGSISLDDTTHDGKSLRCASASAATITIENTVRDGFTVIIHQDGAGVFTVASSTLTLRNADGVISTGGQWTSIIAERKGTDLVITGAIASAGASLNEIALNNMTKLTLSAVCYVEITASRAVTDADNGKILYSTSATAFTLTFPDSLAKPFGCTIKQEGTGFINFAVSGTAVLRSRALSTKTAGQWAMAAIDYRTGNDVVLTGDTIA